MKTSTKQALGQIEEMFEKDQIKEAYFNLKKIVDYPLHLESQEMLIESIRLAAMLGGKFGNEKLLELGRELMEEVTLQKIFAFAQHLCNSSWYEFAASIYAFILSQNDKSNLLVSEYANTLAAMGLHRKAVEELLERKERTYKDATMCYFLAFNAFNAGDSKTGKEAYEKLLPLINNSEESHISFMNRIKGYIERYDQLSVNLKIEDDDLRSWHYILNNSLITYLSPYGMDQMHGRFGGGRDGVAQVKFGAERLKLALQSLHIRPKQVLFVEEFKSEVLARVLGSVLDLPVKKISSHNQNEPGIIAIYNMEKLDHEQYSLCIPIRKDQYTWSHVMNWTSIHTHNSDFVTFQAQMNLSPWDSGLKFNKDNTPDETPDLPMEVKASVKQILESVTSTHEISKEDNLQEFCALIALEEKPKTGWSLFNKSSQKRLFESWDSMRGRVFSAGPVRSNRFGG